MFYIDLNRSLEQSVLLSGVGRGGTTWMADIINHKNEYRLMFEPFHPELTDLWRSKGKLYVRPCCEDRVLVDTGRKILSGEVREKRINHVNRKIICKRRLIKCVFANFLLEWLRLRFSVTNIILLLRHPCAVAHSQMLVRKNKHKSANWLSLKTVLEQRELMDDFLLPFKDRLYKIKDDYLWYVVSCCIQYYVPLRQLKGKGVYLAFYENFVQEPFLEAEKIAIFLRSKHDKRKLFSVIKKPSRTSWNKHEIKTKEQITAWQEKVTEKQQKRVEEILEMFSLSNIYSSHNPNPLAGRAGVF